MTSVTGGEYGVHPWPAGIDEYLSHIPDIHQCELGRRLALQLGTHAAVCMLLAVTFAAFCETEMLCDSHVGWTVQYQMHLALS